MSLQSCRVRDFDSGLTGSLEDWDLIQQDLGPGDLDSVFVTGALDRSDNSDEHLALVSTSVEVAWLCGSMTETQRGEGTRVRTRGELGTRLGFKHTALS